MRKFIGSLLLFIGLGTTAMAETDPSAHLKGIADKMIAVIEENKEALKTDDQLAEKLVREHLLPIIDKQTFARLTIGSKTWKSLSAEQQAAFVKGYINRVIDKYAKGLALYDGQAFKFQETKFSKKNPNLARVVSKLEQEGDQPLDISYTLSKATGDWLITNIYVEGTNMRKSYKQQFLPRIKEIGVAKFIEELNAPVTASAN